jgi:hypothetical protein
MSVICTKHFFLLSSSADAVRTAPTGYATLQNILTFHEIHHLCPLVTRVAKTCREIS